MKLSIIAILASIALTHGFKFETKPADGDYVIEKDASGKEVATFVGALNTTEAANVGPMDTKSTIRGRGNLVARDQVGCTERIMNSGDTNAAVNSLKNYCGNGRSYYNAKMAFVSGGILAYTCDYRGGQLCYASEAAFAYQLITNSCGGYKSGCNL
ncbi:hypothetical protein B0H63DRAFT_527663 [Podospora didyma]|uniref:Uncharacterized protein n=1 Tax=Podospora didyma TaxID=330526 RepID=A0AAE0N3Y8_9PEZI|nr:hypothetical protein B0H63DRAFT_527663 [Podospora didyma]